MHYIMPISSDKPQLIIRTNLHANVISTKSMCLQQLSPRSLNSYSISETQLNPTIITSQPLDELQPQSPSITAAVGARVEKELDKFRA